MESSSHKVSNVPDLADLLQSKPRADAKHEPLENVDAETLQLIKEISSEGDDDLSFDDDDLSFDDDDDDDDDNGQSHGNGQPNYAAIESDKAKIASAEIGIKTLHAIGILDDPLMAATASGNSDLLERMVMERQFCTLPHLRYLLAMAAAYPLEDVAIEMYDIIRAAATGCGGDETSQFGKCLNCLSKKPDVMQHNPKHPTAKHPHAPRHIESKKNK